MAEASGYIFRDVEMLLKEAEEALKEFRTGTPEAYNKHKEVPRCFVWVNLRDRKSGGSVVTTS